MTTSTSSVPMKHLIASALLFSLLGIGARLLLRLGEGSVLCSDDVALWKMVVIGVDFGTIVVLPIVVMQRAAFKAPISPTGATLASMTSLLVFAIYEMVRNPCLIQFL